MIVLGRNTHLGRYTHRVAISNQRLVSFDAQQVCFVTKNNQRVSLAPDEFIRRFLMHVLPRGFVKIRHYGLMAPANTNTLRVLAHRLLSSSRHLVPAPLAVLVLSALVLANLVRTPPEPSWIEHLQQLTGIDVRTCPCCGKGHMVLQATICPARTNHPPLLPFEDTS